MKVVGVFNPGVVMVGDQTLLLVRVVEQSTEARAGYVASPRSTAGGQITVDWLTEADQDLSDPRRYVDVKTGLSRLRFISYLRLFRSRDGQTIDAGGGGAIMPEGPYEEYGIEDPRITRIGQRFYITYVAVSRHGVATCLLSTDNFEQFQRHGIIFYPDNKDVVLFGQKVAGAYVAMHRPVQHLRFTSPQIWIARSPDLIHWAAGEPLVGCDLTWQNDRVGAGTPPIRTADGWLSVVHAAEKPPQSPGAGVYRAGALLLDRQDPRQVAGRSREPIMEPQEPFEKSGFVNEVVFPTALTERDGVVWVYYGAADESVGVVGFDRSQLLATIS